jgi:hypothetical protein
MLKATYFFTSAPRPPRRRFETIFDFQKFAPPFRLSLRAGFLEKREQGRTLSYLVKG